MGGQLKNRLTASDVGKRVSVRTLVEPAERSAGSPTFTDTVGVLTSWTEGVLQVTPRDGLPVRLAESAVVAAKVVPPTPARRRGTPSASVRELTAVAGRGWPAPDRERLGDWVAHAADGWTARANSAYRAAPGPPDLERVSRWYRSRGAPARLQVTTGGADADEALVAALDARGWTAERPAVVLVAPLAPLADREPDARVAVGRELTDAWLAGYPNAARAPEVAARVLRGGPSVWFGTVPAAAPATGGAAAAVARCVVDGRWAGFAAVEVAPERRREGLARALMAELARTALGEGASAAYLQVERDNAPAHALYRSLGFVEHHQYHYRREPVAE